MIISKQVKERLESIPNGIVITLQDFKVTPKYEGALVKALSRLVAKGDLKKTSKGRYYKPRKTIFGTISPAPMEIAKEFLEKNGKLTGYITGTEAFAALGLTSQITSDIVIGSNRYRRPLEKNGYKFSFVLQLNPITKNNIPLLRILDAIKFIKEIPATSPERCIEQLGEIISNLPQSRQKQLCALAKQYAPRVRALLGAIAEQNGLDTFGLRATLNGVTNYKLKISRETLTTKQNWNII
jgi:hypothetical protein